MSERKTLGLVLGSGGSRGIAHIGFLKALEEAGIKPDYISGCSMGSVVGACYASGMTPDMMYSEVKKIKLPQIFTLSLLPYSDKGFIKATKMEKKIYQYLGDVTFNELKIPFNCVAYDLIKGQSVILDEGLVYECVRASSNVPILLEPMRYKRMLLVDGGLEDRVPIDAMQKFKPDVVVAIDVLGNIRESIEIKNLLSLVVRVTDAMEYTVARERRALYQADLLIMPEMGNISQYKIEEKEKIYNSGYELCKKNLKKIKELLNIEND